MLREPAASGAGSLCVERMWRILPLCSGRGMLSLGTSLEVVGL